MSDRCSGKIGDGKVASACSSCVYTLCAEQRGLVIFTVIDAAAGEELAYLHETLAGGVTPAHRFFCVAILRPAHSAAEQLAATQKDKNQFTFLGMTHHHVAWPSWTLLSIYLSPPRHHLQALPRGNHTSKNMSARHLAVVSLSAMYRFELLMTHDVRR